MNGTPNDLKPFDDAYRIQRKIKDEEMWQSGMYVMAAVSVAVNKALYGKKAKNSNYPEKPFSFGDEQNEQEEILTEDQIQKERKGLLMKLKMMQFNFNKNHNK